MHDLLGLSFAVLNIGLSIVTLLFVIRGIRHFKTGLLAKSMKRALPVAILLTLFFLTEALIAIDAFPAATPIDDVLGTLFMLSFLLLAYGFVNDWMHVGEHLEDKK